ncbi:MAG TPA: hypothetical protein EYQ46_19040 [Myxococcales bacterium]|nr:hypothetical protein [Myxococcales bacterium]
MNTPAHALIAVASLAGGSRRPFARHAVAGALLPDIPMFGFYLWQRGYVGLSENQIWNETYFKPDWQLFFDTFNSAPLVLLGFALTSLANPSVRQGLQVFFGAMLLHIMVDLPLHHDDGHRHFLPLSEWRFESPISYWDPAHAGMYGAGLELLCVLGASSIIWRRTQARWVRVLVGTLSALSLFVYAGFYWVRGWVE